MEGWIGRPEAKFIYQCKLYTDGIIASKDPKASRLPVPAPPLPVGLVRVEGWGRPYPMPCAYALWRL